MNPGGVVVPDVKDWTWTLERECPDCGFAAGSVSAPQIAGLVLEFTRAWPQVLARADVLVRPEPGVWSALEYGAHVRDVCRVFADRLTLMLRVDGAQFDNWDQDATAIEQRYAEQDPAVVAAELEAAADRLAQAYAAVGSAQWERTGLRSNGSPFTVLTLGQYALHDLRHHLTDVGAEPA